MNSGSFEDFKKFLDAKVRQAENQTEKFVTMTCQKVESTAKTMMRDTSVNPDVSYGKKNHHPSYPGNPPAPETGALMRSVTHSVNEENGQPVGYVGSILAEYPIDLEYGTSKMKPRPWLSASLIRCQSWISQAWEKLKGGRL